MKLKPDSGCTKFPPVTVAEDGLIWTARLSPEQSGDQRCGFRP